MPGKLVEAILNMDDTGAVKLAREMLDQGEDPDKILEQCQEAMEEVGNRFENKQFFLPELIMSGDILKEITEVVKPKLEEKKAVEKEVSSKGKVLIGTVAGDIHDIGKDIVTFMLEVNGFEVHDLGIDIPVETFVEKTKEIDPDILGLSGFLTLAFESMKSTIQELEKAGCREGLKIMIGGGTVTEKIKDYVGADAFGEDAMEAVKLARNWVKGA